MKKHVHQRNSPRSRSVGGEVVCVRTPDGREREVLGTVTGMLGAGRVTVQCLDSVTRLCRICGRMKKRTWVREGDLVIVIPWSVENGKGDIVWRYTGPQADWLERKGYLSTGQDAEAIK